MPECGDICCIRCLHARAIAKLPRKKRTEAEARLLTWDHAQWNLIVATMPMENSILKGEPCLHS